jgi:hypothetical protein
MTTAAASDARLLAMLRRRTLAARDGVAVDASAASRQWLAARTAVQAAVAAYAAAHGDDEVLGSRLFAGATSPCGAEIAAVDARRLDWPASQPPPTSLATIGNLYPALLAPADRKHSGSWFTPPDLAAATTRRALAGMNSSEVTVCDPAVGAGAFLLAALTQLATQSRRSAGDIVTGQLSGADRDPTAAALAALVLREACAPDWPTVAAVEAKIHCADGLLSLEDGCHDVVLGNPPWETLQEGQGNKTPLRAADRHALRRRYRLCGQGKLYTYRLFVERACQLLKVGGRLGLIVPGSLYFDRDANLLRQHLLDECEWEWLFGFDNRQRIFAIDSRYRFAAIIARKGGRTDTVRTTFLQTDVASWQQDNPRHVRYSREDVHRLSPTSGAFVELRCERDLQILRHVHRHGTPWLHDHGAWSWRQGDYNMTSDVGLFHRRDSAEAEGYRPAPDGFWRREGHPVLRPLYQGAMLGTLHPNAGAYERGTGRGVRWQAPRSPDALEPMYLTSDPAAEDRPQVRVALRALSNATNERTVIACLLGDEPCGNSLGVIRAVDAERPALQCAFLAGVLASLVWDWTVRQRLAGTNLNRFVLADTVVPTPEPWLVERIARKSLQLCAVLPWQSGLWTMARQEGWWQDDPEPLRSAADRRVQQVELELDVARAFELQPDDLHWTLRDCDRPAAELTDRDMARRLDPKGFWRVDRGLAPADRLTTQVLARASELSQPRRPQGGGPAPRRPRSGFERLRHA